jgi:choline dehydrogenase-like flavoprotein
VLGGATRLWAGQCVPLDEEDFERRDWVPGSGWPIGPADLAPHYRAAERLLHIERAVYDERNWNPFRLDPPRWDPGRLRHRFTIWPRRVDMGRLTRRRLARSANVRVLLGATAVRLDADAAGRTVQAAELRAFPDRSGRVTARAFVLASGGIENARLLLLSDLGNEHDLVGRYFQEHPNSFAAEIATRDARWLQDRYALLYRRGRRYLARCTLSPQVQREEAVLNACAMLVFLHGESSAAHTAKEFVRAARERRLPDRLPARLGNLARDAPALGRLAFRRYVRGRSPDAPPERTVLHVFSEQAPNRDSRVTLGAERDALGARVAQVDWRMTELEGRTVGVMARVAAEEFERLGLGRVELHDWMRDEPGTRTRALRDAYHHMGTTRMAKSPGDGVVDPDCRVHGASNLYVAGTSVFPTSSWANPTFTAIALSLRLAEHLRGALSR